MGRIADLPSGSSIAFELWYYYPNWRNGTIRCLHDDEQPFYMTRERDIWMTTDPVECCQQWYSHDFFLCASQSRDEFNLAQLANATSPRTYYPDWEFEVCKNDGQAPSYIALSPDIWMFEDITSCCEQYFDWRMNECINGTV